MKGNLPLPTNPVGGDVVWLHVMIHTDNVTRECKGNSVVINQFVNHKISSMHLIRLAFTLS